MMKEAKAEYRPHNNNMDNNMDNHYDHITSILSQVVFYQLHALYNHE